MLSLTFYGGANEIGGNKILLEDEGTRIYLDFGESFNFGEEYFYDYLTPRSANGLEVLFEFGLIPKVPSLYGRTMLEFTDLKYEKPDIDAVFISHSHSDHCNHLAYIDESIPVCMGHGTRRILEIYAKLYPAFCKYGEHNELRLFKSGDRIRVKTLEIEPIHVEHSIPGAYGFIVHTSKGAVVYTGDLRLHGPKSAMTREFITKAKAAKPYALLCEGTRIARDEERDFTEAEIETKVDEIVSGTKGLVFAYFSMSNVDRFMSFYRVALRNGRRVVVDTKFAYVLDNLKDKIPELPNLRLDPNVLVYYRLAKSCRFDQMDYTPWEREFWDKKITYKEISKAQDQFLMHMSFYKLMELVYLQPKDAAYIYSQSEHFLEGDENKEERTVLENWLRHFGIAFHKAHCSGHASRQDLELIVKAINPKLLVPMHTQNALAFGELHENVVVPERERRINL